VEHDTTNVAWSCVSPVEDTEEEVLSPTASPRHPKNIAIKYVHVLYLIAAANCSAQQMAKMAQKKALAPKFG